MTRDHLMRIAGLKGAARIDEVLPALEGLYELVRELEIKNEVLVTANRTMGTAFNERQAAITRAEKAEQELAAFVMSSVCEYCGRRDVPALTQEQARTHLRYCPQSPLIPICRRVKDAVRCLNPSPAAQHILENLLREELAGVSNV